MKTVILALLVLVVISHGDALTCYCGGRKYCYRSTETCYGSDDICATVTYYGGNGPNFFKGCMTYNECLMKNEPGESYAYCCSRDLCN